MAKIKAVWAVPECSFRYTCGPTYRGFRQGSYGLPPWRRRKLISEKIFPLQLCKSSREPRAVPVTLLWAVTSHREKEGAEANNHFSKKCVWYFSSVSHRGCQLSVCWRKRTTKYRAGQGRTKLTWLKANQNFSCCKFGGRNAVPSFLPHHSHTQNNLKLVVKKINCRESPWRALAANCSH